MKKKKTDSVTFISQRFKQQIVLHVGFHIDFMSDGLPDTKPSIFPGLRPPRPYDITRLLFVTKQII